MQTDQVIHEWLGKCWHEWDDPCYPTCTKCGYVFDALGNRVGNPTYSASLDLVREAELKAIETFGRTVYFDRLTDACILASPDTEDWFIATAPADVRAAAIRKLIEEK